MLISTLLSLIRHLITIRGNTNNAATAEYMSPAIQTVTQPVDHAEAPFWDHRTNLLYFVDIHAGTIYSYDYYADQLNSVRLNGDVTPVIPTRNNFNRLIVGLNRSVVALRWNGRTSSLNNNAATILTTVSPQFPTSRFNDGKADNAGRLWFGTMGFENPIDGVLTPNQGVLYRITKNNLANPSVQLAPVNISNGMAWSRDNQQFYYIDTPTRKIIEWQFNESSGALSAPSRVAFDLAGYNDVVTGSPDGMTIDADGNLWVALYDGGAIIKVDPRNGQLLQTVAMPAVAVTSVAWGGPNFDVLFVTTSRYRLNSVQRRQQPAAGSVFAVSGLGTRGFPAYQADIDILS